MSLLYRPLLILSILVTAVLLVLAEEENFEYFTHPTTAIGFPGANQGSEITPEGSLFTGRAELVFFVGKERTPVDQRVKRLVNGYLPIVEFDVEQEGIAFRFSYFAHTWEGKPEGDLINFANVQLRNSASTRSRAVLWVAMKFSQGDHRVAKMKFDRGWVYAFDGQFATRSGQVICLYPRGANARFAMPGQKYRGPFRGSDLGVEEDTPVLLSRYEIHLAPSESRSLSFLVPSVPTPVSEANKLKSLDPTEERSQVTRYWEDVLNGGMQLEIPERKVVNTYRANLVYLLMGLHKVGEDLVTYVNRFQYESFYLRDGALQLRGLDMFGYHNWVKPATLYFLKKQQINGLFLSQPSQLDGWGQALWALGEHYRLTQDEEYARKVYPAVWRAVLWLSWKRRKSKISGGLGAGLMPPTEPGDAELNYGHVIGNDFWALAGLWNAVALAEAVGDTETAAKWQQELEDYRQHIIRALEKVVPQLDGWIPPILEGNGIHDWGNYKVVYPAGALPPFHPWVTASLNKAREQFREGLVTKLTPDIIHHYIGIDIHQTEVIRGEQEKVLEGFYSHLLHTTSTHAGFEGASYKRRDFGTNLAPHGCFSGKFLMLLRNMVVREEGSRLHLFSALSPAWVQPGKRVEVRNAPTYFGPVDARLTFDTEGAELIIEAPRRRSFDGFVFHAPPGYMLLKVYRNGESWGRFDSRSISLPPDNSTVRITWQKEQDVALSYARTVQVYLESLKERTLQKEKLVAMNRSNLAFRKSVESSMEPTRALDLFPLQQVVDGDEETYALFSPLPQFVTVDLGQEQEIRRIELVLYSVQMFLPGPSEHIYSVSLSSDAKDWIDIVRIGRRRAEQEAHFDHVLSPPVHGRYVRVTIHYNSPFESFGWGAIAEIVVE